MMNTVLSALLLGTLALSSEAMDRRSEYRREAGYSHRFREVRDLHYSESRIADAEKGRVGIDAQGRRVRMEEHLNISAKELKYTLYNYRDGRTDSLTIGRAFDQDLPVGLRGIYRPYLWDVFVLESDGNVRTYAAPPPGEPSKMTDITLKPGDSIFNSNFILKGYNQSGLNTTGLYAYQETMAAGKIYNDQVDPSGPLKHYGFDFFSMELNNASSGLQLALWQRTGGNTATGERGTITQNFAAGSGFPPILSSNPADHPIVTTDENGSLGNGLTFARQTRFEFKTPDHPWIEWGYTSLSDDGKSNTSLGNGLFNGWIRSSYWGEATIDILSPTPISGYGFNFSEPNPF